MKKALFFTSVLFVAARLFADNPTRISLSDVSYSNRVTTAGIGGVSGFHGRQISSGVVLLDYAWVASTGSNSRLLVYDSNVYSAGNSSKTIEAGTSTDNPNEKWIPFYTQSSTQGFVYSSTCTACGSPWVAPSLRFTYLRIR